MKLGEFEGGGKRTEDLSQLLERFNDTARPYPRDKTVHALFAHQAALRPDAVAIVDGEHEYKYRDVEQASNRFARFLMERGMQREDLVALLLQRPFEIVVAMLGTLKAGCAYVPIDPGLPIERVKRLLKGVAARTLVSERRHMRLINRLQWECPDLSILFCADSRNIHREAEEPGDFMLEAAWEQVGRAAVDDISGGGWVSSYTGELLSREVMDEYGDNVRDKLRPYLSKATRVLEIGCASGITLSRIAPLVGFYCGTDLSPHILDWTRRDIARRGWEHVHLRQCAAHEIDRGAERDFNVVILNSVVECFSGHNYLRDVLRKAIDRMAECGIIFLGNLWDLDKEDAFIRSLEAFANANPSKGYRTKLDRSQDLWLSREFIRDLQHDFPEIRDIEFSRMPGETESELSEFGFDAILRIDRGATDCAASRERKKFQYDLTALEHLAPDPLEERSSPDGLAYVMYTSGTSGEPKGVMIEHRAIARLVVNADYVELTPEDRILQTGSLAFDASTFEIWGPLLNGGAVCLPSERAVLDAAEVTRLIARHRITTMFVTTSLFNHFVDSDINMFAGLRQLLTGGERASSKHFDKIRQRHPRLRLIHMYGPTENTTFTTHLCIERSYSADVPIGRPIGNTEVLILDPDGNPVPVGVSGEIHAAGDGLARGYLRDPELTRQKFVAHPFQSGTRIYRTGDLGLWRADGTIEYLGRIDGQVKIRGYRIEPGEVEFQLREDLAINEAVVLAANLGGPDKELVAYVTARQGVTIDVGEIRSRLKRALPDYMVPAHFVCLQKMPLNANGKLDRASLPMPSGTDRSEKSAPQAPASETERELIAIWQEVLGRDRIGVTDNFFASGGHSLRVVKVASLIERRLGAVVPIKVLFALPTIRELAKHILEGARFDVSGIDDAMVPLSVDAEGPNLFALPPGTGDALGFAQIASRLPCRFYGFNFIQPDSRLRDYADLIMQVDPEGPYLLFGYSSGGNLAYHVARELEERDRRVRAIIMVDSMRSLHPTPMSEQEIAVVTANFLADVSLQGYSHSPVLRDKAEWLVSNALRYAATSVDYHTIDCDIHVLTCEHPITEYRDAAGKLLASQAGWAEVIRGELHIHQGVGDHNHMLAHPYLDRNAAAVARILRGMARSSASAAALATPGAAG